MPNREQEVRDLAIRTRDEARGIIVTTPETFERAGTMLKAIKEVRNQINAIFDPIISAAHNAHKVALDQKKDVEKFYVEADKHLRGQVSEFNRLQEEERNRAAAALAVRGDMALPAEATKVSGVSFVTKWCFEVNDPDAVPKEFTMPDEVKIRRRVEALGESANIPGVRVWKYKSAQVRG